MTNLTSETAKNLVRMMDAEIEFNLETFEGKMCISPRTYFTLLGFLIWLSETDTEDDIERARRAILAPDMVGKKE